MPAPQIIHELIDRFDRNIEAYESGKYNEMQVRREFIDPFFEALGWDVNNTAGNAETYKDVIHEDAVKVSGVTKAPDYAFRIGGQRKFFVEAKKPSINLKDEPAAAFQIRRYAWSAKLPLSIITDFEEFAVYDCRIKPDQKDKADKARIIYLTYRQYADKWDEIAAIFSKDAILKGSFDKFAESSRAKRGTSEVDNAFLSEIESWRDALARNIALRNTLSVRELNDAVQRTIDRVIFLRIAEDRGIEDYGSLRALYNGNNTYGRLQELFYKADDRYNSGLFHFRHEKDEAEPPDNLTIKLTIDDKPLKEILQRLYYPDSPYEFSVLPADILGQVYEQFLGKVIRLTSDHRAAVEDKPEVKKAGGVFYTPTYIVDYIVKNTVGKLLEGKNPKTAEKLRILDPACGSGSFLLGAYQCLLDWHLKWYVENNPEKYAKAKKPILYQGAGGAWYLTTAERKRILLNNIFGVDIDIQAVEVTKLSLLLKVLEDETGETLNHQFKLFHERALPNLGGNIKCGNSLIGPDFYDGKQMTLLDNAEAQRVNIFDWQAEFSEIFEAGGFDAVIGNPPWGCFFSSNEKKYLSQNYVNKKGEAESQLYFIEKGFRCLNKNGLLGFITPNTWLAISNALETRNFLLSESFIYEIDHLSKYIFNGAPDIIPILIFLKQHSATDRFCIVKSASLNKVTGYNFNEIFRTNTIDPHVWLNDVNKAINVRSTSEVLSIISKCNNKANKLKNICQVLYGIKTGDNEKFLSKSPSDSHAAKALKTGDVARYSINWKGLYLWWCESLAGYRKSSLEVEKIVIQYIRKISLPRRIVAGLDIDGSYYPLNNYSYVVSEDNVYSLKYILGIINSSLINFYFANTFIDYNIKPIYLQQLPIHNIDFAKPDEKKMHDVMVQLVEQMLSLHQQLAQAKITHEQTLLQRQIDATDKQIDKMVYELYELSPEEIKVVEG
jgi:type I restriction-modification system DNA methylase subunit